MKTLKEFFTKIENLDWKVDKEGENEYMLSKFSPYGQDFRIIIHGENVDDLLDSIFNEYDSFDVSQETYLWLDNTGHGVNGAPYEMEDVLNDMKDCEQMILDLHESLSE